MATLSVNGKTVAEGMSLSLLKIVVAQLGLNITTRHSRPCQRSDCFEGAAQCSHLPIALDTPELLLGGDDAESTSAAPLSGLFQRFTFRETRRMLPVRFSTAFVVARPKIRSQFRPPITRFRLYEAAVAK